MSKYFIFQNVHYDLLETQKKIKEAEEKKDATLDEVNYIEKLRELCREIAEQK